MTVFVGCGFAAKYREGGGVFSVPLQWILGLKRLKLDAIWLELFPSSGNEIVDLDAIRFFQRQVRSLGLNDNYCLLYQPKRADAHELEEMRVFGLTKRELRARLAGSSTILNLSYSIHPPLLLEFERRVFCDLDPSEIFYWMTKMEMGQSSHHEFWTIGLNLGGPACRLPKSPLAWKTFFPLVDTELLQPQPKPSTMTFTTIGQWYWGGAVEVDGDFPDLSKKLAFEKYLSLPGRVPEARFELAMNMGDDQVERERLRKYGWHVIDPHHVAKSVRRYYRYMRRAAGEFTAIKGVDVAWQTGWFSDRAAAFLAMGRPVITEDTGAASYLPAESGCQFVNDLTSAVEAVSKAIGDWKRLSEKARAVAVEIFDSAKNVGKILGI